MKGAISGDILALWSENLNATAQSLANAARRNNVLYLLSLLHGEGAIELSADEVRHISYTFSRVFDSFLLLVYAESGSCSEST